MHLTVRKVALWQCAGLRDFPADMLSKIVNDVETEPELQPVTGEVIEGLFWNASRPDIRANGVWRAG